MKIAVDARELAGRRTGVGRYLSELLNEWSASDAATKHEWLLYSHQPLRVPAPFAATVRLYSGSGGTQWEQVTLRRAIAADRPDVLFAPGYTAPLRISLPIALTIHDVSFFAHPEWFTFREGMRRRVLTRLSAARARVVLTDSAFSRDEIARHLGVARGKIRVVPLGIRRQAAKSNENTREPLVLFVGSIFRRRHVDTLVQAFATRVVPQVPGSRLEIVGDNRTYPHLNLERVVTLQTLEAQRRISLRSYVDDQTLAELYSRASVFAFPSEYEGFGLTPLEALSAGVPPVVLDTPIATEIYGGAAKYVPIPHGSASGASYEMADRLGQALVQMLTEQARRNDVLRHAPGVLSRYRWEKTAAEVLAVLEEAGRV